MNKNKTTIEIVLRYNTQYANQLLFTWRKSRKFLKLFKQNKKKKHTQKMMKNN